MSETDTPEVPAAEPTPEVATAPEPAKPEQPAEPDYRAAYVGLQRSQNKLHQRTESLLAQNSALAEAVKSMKESQAVILKQTVGEDEFKAIEAREAHAQERAAATQAAKATEKLVVAQTRIFMDLLGESGINPDTIDWASDANGPDEWAERVGHSVKAAVRNANEQRIKRHEEGLKAKSSREVKEEAAALTERQLKEAGVDRIDTAKGSSTASFVDRLQKMDSNSDDFQRMIEQAKSGRLTI